MGEVPLPVVIGGTTFTTERVSGPPSRMLPALRDLADGTITSSERNFGVGDHANVTVEIDTVRGRKRGIISAYRQDGGTEIISVATGISIRTRTTAKLENIIAFRVLKVEVDA